MSMYQLPSQAAEEAHGGVVRGALAKTGSRHGDRWAPAGGWPALLSAASRMNADPQPNNALDCLGVVAEARERAGETLGLAARHLDPSLVDVLRILGFDKKYAAAQGSYLYDSSGRAYLDFHTGEGFASLGHNNPDVREVLRATLAADLVDGVQVHYSALAGMLAEALSARLPPGLDAA